MFDPDTIEGEEPEPPRKLWFQITVPFDVFWSFLRRFFSARAFLFCAFLGLPGSALGAVGEICGDGIDNDASGGDAACSDCDIDRDGYLAVGSGCANNYFNTGAAQVNGTQGSVTTITVDTGHTFGPGKIADFGSGVTRVIASNTKTSFKIYGAVVSVTDNQVLSVVSQWDANDGDRDVSPGVSTIVDATAGFYHTAQTDGTYNSEIALASFVCPGYSNTKFVDDAETDCSGDGSYGDPEDYRCWSDSGMSGYHAPTDGTCIVLKSAGAYDTNHTGGTKHFYINNADCSTGCKLTVLPGQSWTDLGIGSGARIVGTASSNGAPVEIVNSDGWAVSDLEVLSSTGSSTIGIWFSGGTKFEAYNVAAHGIRGVAANNLSGIRANDATFVNIHHFIAYDNYESGNLSNSDIADVLIMDVDDWVVRDGVVYSTSGNESGAGVKLKHKGLRGRIRGMVVFNKYQSGFLVDGYADLIIEENYLEQVSTANSGATQTFFDDGTVGSVWRDNEVRYNTVVNSPWFEARSLDAAETGSPFAHYHHNNVKDNRGTAYPSDGVDGFIRVGHYDSDALYAELITGSTLVVENECWKAATTYYFDIFNDGSGSGASYTTIAALAAATGLCATGCFDEDFNPDADGRGQSTNCQDKGHKRLADVSGSTTTTTTTTTSTTTSIVAANIGGLAPWYQ